MKDLLMSREIAFEQHLPEAMSFPDRVTRSLLHSGLRSRNRERARAAVRLPGAPKRLEELYQNRVLGASCKSYFQHYYDRLRYYDKEEEHAAKALLRELALAYPESLSRAHMTAVYRRTLGEFATDDRFAGLVGILENDFYIRYRTEEGGYTFASKVLCDWWRRYYAF